MLPFWTSLLVRTYAWLVLLQRQGLVNTWGMRARPVGRAAGAGAQPHRHADRHGAHHAAVPRAAGARRRCARSTATTSRPPPISARVPRARSGRCSSRCRCPGCFAGALIVFILCLGFYVTPAVLGGGKVIMVSNRIANDIELFFNWGAASALGVVLLVLTLLFLYVASRYAPRACRWARAACSSAGRWQRDHELARRARPRTRRSRTARGCGSTRSRRSCWRSWSCRR